MTIKEAVLLRYDLYPEVQPEAAEASRVLFQNRLMLTGEPCPVCDGTGRAAGSEDFALSGGCASCYASGRELARVWPPELAKKYFAPQESAGRLTADGNRPSVERCQRSSSTMGWLERHLARWR